MDTSLASAYDGMQLCEYKLGTGREAEVSRNGYNQIIGCLSYQKGKK